MIRLDLDGRSSGGTRDLVADAMVEAAKRMTRTYPARVWAGRGREGRYEVDGFVAWTVPVVTGTEMVWRGPVVYVPVRRRLCIGRFRRPWREVRSVPEAASEVGRLVRSGPS